MEDDWKGKSGQGLQRVWRRVGGWVFLQEEGERRKKGRREGREKKGRKKKESGREVYFQSPLAGCEEGFTHPVWWVLFGGVVIQGQFRDYIKNIEIKVRLWNAPLRDRKGDKKTDRQTKVTKRPRTQEREAAQRISNGEQEAARSKLPPDTAERKQQKKQQRKKRSSYPHRTQRQSAAPTSGPRGSSEEAAPTPGPGAATECELRLGEPERGETQPVQSCERRT